MKLTPEQVSLEEQIKYAEWLAEGDEPLAVQRAVLASLKQLRELALSAQGEPGKCVAPPCKCSPETRTVCAYWHEASPPAQGVVMKEYP